MKKLIIQFLLILIVLSFGGCYYQNYQSVEKTKKDYTETYKEYLPQVEKVLVAGYNYVRTYNPELNKYIKRVFIPEDKVLIDYVEYKDALFSTYHGEIKSYHPNGNLALEVAYVDGMRQGISSEYHFGKQNALKAQGKYKNNEKYDEWKYFYEDGKSFSTYIYIDGQKHGPYVLYDKEGKIKEEGMYVRGEKKENTVQYFGSNKKGNSNYEEVEKKPKFPGCEDVKDPEERDRCQQKKLLTFLYSNLKYPERDRLEDVEGLNVIKFRVLKDGSVSNIYGYKVVTRAMEKAAIQVVKKMPKWYPGTQNGEAVDVEFALPVRFKLQ